MAKMTTMESALNEVRSRKPFRIVSGYNAETLETAVNSKLREGYKLVGGITTDKHGNLCQAVVWERRKR